ncbi:hypothetical protein ATY81_26865 [Rhizobium sp. R72]|uniref:hypothetical protein n=1 Tax=unclassified Rhizobium TaxID=2613769 RepID=UPI000B538493|nr:MULTISPECIES: hypothetical protein [unclassified Rhizobium]OWV98650.1 hypothetical protein ATY81_26865 [Rhizobium sp. R72]OWV98684.1 hypothetical protein ATY80_26865 [Rhizobium sp. R711]
MPANWYLTQHLNPNNGRIEWPGGPITGVDPGYDPKWVEAWAVQGGGLSATQIWMGPSQSTTQSSWSGFTPGSWAAAEPGWKNGNFQPGLAMGISLLALRNNATGTYEYEWWFEVVMLQ